MRYDAELKGLRYGSIMIMADQVAFFFGTWGANWCVAHDGWNHRIPMDRTSRDFCTLDWKKRICRIFVVGFVKMF